MIIINSSQIKNYDYIRVYLNQKYCNDNYPELSFKNSPHEVFSFNNLLNLSTSILPFRKISIF